jgi:hypothetical protein
MLKYRDGFLGIVTGQRASLRPRVLEIFQILILFMDLNVHPKFYKGIRTWRAVSRDRKSHRRIVLEIGRAHV